MCDWYFDPDDYDETREAEIIHRVRSDAVLTIFEKKELILCWFDTVYGEWSGTRFDTAAARARMSAWLTENNYDTFELLFEQPNG